MIMCKLLSMVYGLFKPCCFTHVTSTCFKETDLFFNVHLSCFVDFILCPTDKCMFKVNSKKIRLIYRCSSLKINTACHRFFVFIIDFDHSQDINIVRILSTLSKYLSVGGERQLIAFWKPYLKAYFISNLSLYPIEITYDHITKRIIIVIFLSGYLICYIIAISQRFNPLATEEGGGGKVRWILVSMFLLFFHIC